MTPQERKVLAAAKAWWRDHRPLWTPEKLHLLRPTINTVTPAEFDLAKAVAAAIRAKKPRGKGRS